ncbi:hypothetical protein F2Q69_00004698 [Brassica cretica]|uniref:Uncharacterized protein n=1 Tax=Brassica cretica TaxID=69181 RepID=A0A8S9P2S0_BRACR|nr:hypothetical protein F2Q69_00004698 [Brassica cretica]
MDLLTGQKARLEVVEGSGRSVSIHSLRLPLLSLSVSGEGDFSSSEAASFTTPIYRSIQSSTAASNLHQISDAVVYSHPIHKDLAVVLRIETIQVSDGLVGDKFDCELICV